jgi:hypothetical protein
VRYVPYPYHRCISFPWVVCHCAVVSKPKSAYISAAGHPRTAALRSLGDIARAQSEGPKRSDDSSEYTLPEGMPRGPYPTAASMKDALNAWAHPLGFNLKLGRLVPSVEHGSWYYLQRQKIA